MFGFILGFILGGVTGAAIVLALSPSYQHQSEEEMPSGGPDDDGAETAGLGELIKNKVGVAIEESKRTLHQAVEEGKTAAASKTDELEEQVRKTRGQEGEDGV